MPALELHIVRFDTHLPSERLDRARFPTLSVVLVKGMLFHTNALTTVALPIADSNTFDKNIGTFFALQIPVVWLFRSGHVIRFHHLQNKAIKNSKRPWPVKLVGNLPSFPTTRLRGTFRETRNKHFCRRCPFWRFRVENWTNLT